MQQLRQTPSHKQRHTQLKDIQTDTQTDRQTDRTKRHKNSNFMLLPSPAYFVVCQLPEMAEGADAAPARTAHSAHARKPGPKPKALRLLPMDRLLSSFFGQCETKFPSLCVATSQATSKSTSVQGWFLFTQLWQEPGCKLHVDSDSERSFFNT